MSNNPAMSKQKKGSLYIGTSNIVVPGNKPSFPQEYQQKSRLHYYSTLFNSLEVNSSFYKVPMCSTFEKWSADVPENFRFSIKLWKEITHAKNLSFTAEQVNHYMKAAAGVGIKKGCLLIQFPGKISLDYYNEVETLLELLQQQDPDNGWQKAVEFRSASWYVSETHELLDSFNASLVLHDIPKSRNTDFNKRAKVIYIRYHGPTGDYRGSYTHSFLEEQYQQMQVWMKLGKDVYAYFNNTMGNALENAMYLKSLRKP